MKRKIVLCSLLTAVLCLGLFACERSESSSDDGSDNGSTTVAEAEPTEDKPLAATVDDINAVGDVVEFGSYKDKSVAWRVLAIEDGRALLLSQGCVDNGCYDSSERAYLTDPCTWEECTLRTWLNSDFFLATFSGDDQTRVLETRVINEDNPEYETSGGNDTTDRVFLLSIAEANQYFYGEEDRVAPLLNATNTTNMSGNSNNSDIAIEEGYGWFWWLRSPGVPGGAAYVYMNGAIYNNGVNVFNTDYGIRPALWVSL